jgi:hypothetical protein
MSGNEMNKTTLLLAMATPWPAAALFYSFHFRLSFFIV